MLANTRQGYPVPQGQPQAGSFRALRRRCVGVNVIAVRDRLPPSARVAAMGAPFQGVTYGSAQPARTGVIGSRGSDPAPNTSDGLKIDRHWSAAKLRRSHVWSTPAPGTGCEIDGMSWRPKIVGAPAAGRQNRGVNFDQDDPAQPVLEHDDCFHPNGIDVDRWSDTMFFPVVMISESGQTVLDDMDAFAKHLTDLASAGRAFGVHGIRTRILSNIQTSEDVAIISSIRDRIDGDGEVIGSASITWLLVRDQGHWKINQIHFNDGRLDPSIVAYMESRAGDKE